jgi:hypothetical protein
MLVKIRQALKGLKAEASSSCGTRQQVPQLPKWPFQMADLQSTTETIIVVPNGWVTAVEIMKQKSSHEAN